MTTDQYPGKTDTSAGVRRTAVITMIDQIVSSASNFALGAVVARAGGATALGHLGIAVLVWLVVVGTNRALVTEPMTVTGSLEARDAQLREGMFASLLVGVVASCVVGTACGVLLIVGVDATGVLSLAPWIPCLLLQDYWRAMAFRLRLPEHALINDCVFAVVQGLVTVGMFIYGSTSVAALLAAWGIGATAGSLVGLVLARVQLSMGGGAEHIRSLWARSRWFLAEFGTAFTSSQGYMLLLPVLLGAAPFGLFRAGASLIGPVVVIFLAAGNVALPQAVRQLSLHGSVGLARFTPRLTAVVVAMTTLYCGTVAVYAEPVLVLVYGSGFSSAAIVAQLLAVQYIVLAFAYGFGIALKASGQMKQLWLARAMSALVSIFGLLILSTRFGVAGAGLAAIMASASYAVLATFSYRQASIQGFAVEKSSTSTVG